MTEQKKEYIMDALSELEDKYVAEAAEYIRQKAGWKYWRELGAAAACVAAVLVTVTTLEYLPIGRMTESAATAENTSQLSGNKQEMAMDSVSAESAMEESFCMEIVVNTATEEAEKQNAGSIQNNREMFRKYLSRGLPKAYRIRAVWHGCLRKRFWHRVMIFSWGP